MKAKLNLDTPTKNTWCPGCGNFGIERAFKKAIAELISEGFKKELFVISSGIGCHGKICDYINLNSFYSIHGRVIPVITGVKLANPDLIVIGFAGDGDAYGEGISHLIFGAKRNVDMTFIVHNNRVYALTTGQFTPTSPKGFPGKSTPRGSVEKPFNPIELMLITGATFIARGYSGMVEHLKNLIKEAIKHKGFSFIDVLQPCVTFFNTYEFYNQRVYDLQEAGHDFTDFDEAMRKAREWDYNSDSKIPIGIFYKIDMKTYEDQVLRGKNPSRAKPIETVKHIIERYRK